MSEIVLQDNLKDCGVSSLLTIVKYYHGDIPKEYLIDLTKTSNNGASAFYLLKAAQQIGFDTKALKGDISLLNDDDFPLIAHTIINNSYSHFQVVFERKNNYLIVGDPASGIKKIKLKDWNNISTNKYLLLKPIRKLPIIKPDLTFKKVLLNIFNKYKKDFINVLLISFVYTVINVITSYNFKILIDDTNIYNIKYLKLILIFLLVLGILKNISNLFRFKVMNYISHKIDKELVETTYDHIIKLPYVYYKTRTSGDIIKRITDISNIKDFITKIFLTIIVDGIMLVIVLCFLFKISIKLTIYTIIIGIMYLVIMLIYNGIFKDKINKNFEYSSETNSYLIETINSIETIKGINIENNIINKFKFKYHNFSKSIKEISDLITKESFYKESINYIGILLISYYGVIDVINNNMKLTTLITFITLINYFLEPIKNIVDLNFSYKNSKASIKRVIELYQLPKEDLSKVNGLNNMKGNITFKDINYSYNGIKNILNNFNLEIKDNNRVLISGDSGNGKSTIVKLLNGSLTDYEGNIYVNNINLKNYTLSTIRDKICYVGSNEMLYTDTLLNNISMYRDIDYKKILKVSKITKLDRILNKLPLGYDSMIEENGFNLSSGERQRIILARTLCKEADIYIFDESLNALDIKTERIILQNIFKYLKNKTIIVISHRFNNNDLFNQKVIVE